MDVCWLFKNHRAHCSRKQLLDYLIEQAEKEGCDNDKDALIESMVFARRAFGEPGQARSQSSKTEYVALNVDAEREKNQKDYEECSLGFGLEEEQIRDYDFIRGKLFFRLVHFDKNREILKFCPYDRIEDLALTYRWIAYRNEDGMASAMIRKRDLEMWGVSEEQMKRDARENTEKMFPPAIKKIENVIPIEIETGNIPIFVLSNGDYMNGASAMMYDKVLYDFASTMGENLYILPSSIHEVILLLERDAGDVRELCYMVKETNRTAVDPEEVLSDHVYYYDRQEDKIHIADDAGWTDMM